MKNKTIIYVFVVVLGLIGLMFLGKSTSKSISTVPGEITGGVSTLVSSETVYDFGDISMSDGIVTKIFKVTNPTDKDVNIKSIFTSCMCTTAYIESEGGEKGPFGMEGMGYLPPADEVIKAGESRNVRVVYDPNAHGPAGVGYIDRFIYLTDVSSGTLELEIKATVRP